MSRITYLNATDTFSTQLINGYVVETLTEQWPHGVTVETAKSGDGSTVETVRDAGGEIVRTTTTTLDGAPVIVEA